jgi:hypothetical protein
VHESLSGLTGAYLKSSVAAQVSSRVSAAIRRYQRQSGSFDSRLTFIPKMLYGAMLAASDFRVSWGLLTEMNIGGRKTNFWASA